MLPLWVWACLAGALAQTGRNATQAGLTARLGTLGATADALCGADAGAKPATP